MHLQQLLPLPSPLFDRPEGCIDQLTLEERAAILTMHKLGMSRSEIAHRGPMQRDSSLSLDDAVGGRALSG